jgi:hypothetical protein
MFWQQQEPEQKKELATIAGLVGFEPTVDLQLEKNWAALEGNSYQASLVDAFGAYFKSFREGLSREMQDAMTKADFLKQWTTKKFTFTVEPESFVGADYAKDKVAAWSGYNGLRFVNGDLDLFTKTDRFYSNVDYVFQIKYEDLLKNVKDDLPLVLRKDLRDDAERIEKVKARIAAAVGVDKVEWDIVEDAKAILGNPKVRADYAFSTNLALQYMDNLAYCLEKKCADDMVKEAIADAFSAKKISLKCYDDLNGLKGLETHSSYNGIQFLDGQIIVFARSDNWACNIDQVSYEHDLVKLF